MKLLTSPTLISPFWTRHAPPTSNAMLAMVGTASSSDSNVARIDTALMRAWRR